MKKSTILLTALAAFLTSEVNAQCPDGLNGPVIVEEYSTHTYFLTENGVNWPYSDVNGAQQICEPEESEIINYSCEGGIVTSTSSAGDNLEVSITVTWGAIGPGSLTIGASAGGGIWVGDPYNDCLQNCFVNPGDQLFEFLIIPAATNVEEQANVDDYLNFGNNLISINKTNALSTVNILSVSGQLVASTNPNLESTINLNSFSNGVYLIQLILNDGTPLTKKVAVNH